MGIDIPPLRPTSLPDNASDRAKERSRVENPDKVKASINSMILAAHEGANFSAKDDPLSLIYKAAIESLNERLSSVLGEEGLEGVEPEEYTPEATAGRIVGFATKFFGQYKTQNPDLSDEDALDNFMEIISSAIDSGYSEAVEILEGLKVFEGDVEEKAGSTRDFIDKFLEEFRAKMSGDEELGTNAGEEL